MLRLIPKNQEKRQVPPELASLGLPDRLLELLLDRQIDTPEKIERYLHPKREDLHDPMRMQDMGKAVAVIRDALRSMRRSRFSAITTWMALPPRPFF